MYVPGHVLRDILSIYIWTHPFMCVPSTFLPSNCHLMALGVWYPCAFRLGVN